MLHSTFTSQVCTLSEKSVKVEICSILWCPLMLTVSNRTWNIPVSPCLCSIFLCQLLTFHHPKFPEMSSCFQWWKLHFSSLESWNPQPRHAPRTRGYSEGRADDLQRGEWNKRAPESRMPSGGPNDMVIRIQYKCIYIYVYNILIYIYILQLLTGYVMMT